MKVGSLLGITLMLSSLTLAQKITRDYDRSINMKEYKTYSWIEQEKLPIYRADVVENPAMTDEQVDQLIRKAVDEALQKKGLQLLTEGEADFRVTYVAGSQFDLGVRDYDPGASGIPSLNYGHWRPFYQPGQDKHLMRRGNVSIDVIDTESTKLAWRGTANNVLPTDRDKAAKQTKKVENMIKKVLSKFPPK